MLRMSRSVDIVIFQLQVSQSDGSNREARVACAMLLQDMIQSFEAHSGEQSMIS